MKETNKLMDILREGKLVFLSYEEIDTLCRFVDMGIKSIQFAPDPTPGGSIRDADRLALYTLIMMKLTSMENFEKN